MKAWTLVFSLFAAALDVAGAQWETCNSGRCGMEFSVGDGIFGGTFTRSRDFHYVADTRIGGRVRRSDRIEASGRVRLEVGAGFNSGVQLGHFEAYGGGAPFTDFLGITFMEHVSGKMRAQARIHFNRGNLRTGSAVVLPVGDYAWSYQWDPLGGIYGFGLLRARFDGPVSASSELHLSADTFPNFFACNAFGLFSGYAPTEAPEAARIFVSGAQYSCVPAPDLAKALPRTPVFLLIGQGNARGKDPSVTALQSVIQRDPNVYVYTDQWTYAQGPTEPRNYFGPEMALGRELVSQFEQPVAIIKVTTDGRTLGEEWMPECNSSYRRLIDTARSALAGLRAPDLRAIFVVSGEPDALSQSAAERYDGNIRKLHQSILKDLRVARVPMIVARLTPHVQTPYSGIIRRAQEQMFWVDTDDLGHVGDRQHYNGAGLDEVGLRLGQRYGAIPFPQWTPDSWNPFAPREFR